MFASVMSNVQYEIICRFKALDKELLIKLFTLSQITR